MNDIAVKLEVLYASLPQTITVKMPPSSGVVATPGPYMLWLLNEDIPATQAAWITLQF
jgi:hypothetical protein